MSQAEKAESARTPEPDGDQSVLCHIHKVKKNDQYEKQRKFNTLHNLHRALAAAEADIIARKGSDWNKAAQP